jgi:hypothetical protein
MIINLNVQAEVIDIRTDRPQQSDIFLVDTNVWIWQTYPNARTSPTKIREYELISRERDRMGQLWPTLV